MIKGVFQSLCTIVNLHIDRALCDLGASINMMSYSIYKKLELQEPQPTNISLLLADTTLTYSWGIVENLLVKVGKFIFPIYFLIMDMNEDEKIPIILRWPFLYEEGFWLISDKGNNLEVRWWRGSV